MTYPIGIPSWAIGVAGAALVIVSAALGAVVLAGVDADVNEAQRKISALNERTQRLAEIRLLADQQAAIALNFIAVGMDSHSSAILSGMTRGSSFVLERGGQHLLDAVREMWRATGADADDGTDVNVAVDEICVNEAGEDWESVAEGHLEKAGQQGGVDAYNAMYSILGEHRKHAACVIAYQRRQIVEHEARREELRVQHGRVRGQQITLNILGLVIVLLKDLPIWRRPNP